MVAQEVANALEQTLDLPSILPHGARLDPTADGFLIQLPTCEIPLLCTLHFSHASAGRRLHGDDIMLCQFKLLRQ